ncbi:hypothetical protein ACA910_004621 [Epithemia clementina (nom. ined.)]
MKIASSTLLAFVVAAECSSATNAMLISEMKQERVLVSVVADQQHQVQDSKDAEEYQPESLWTNNITTDTTVVPEEIDACTEATGYDNVDGKERVLLVSEASYRRVSSSPGDTTVSTTSSTGGDGTVAATNTPSPQVPELVDDMFGSDMGTPQELVAGSREELQVQRRIQEARTYMQTVGHQDPSYRSVRSHCINHHEMCAFWAVLGECDKNPAYMKLNCAPVCRSCDQLDITKRCPLDPNATDALAQPGDLDRLFYKLVTNPEFAQFQPKAVSYPAAFAKDPAIVDTTDAAAITDADGPWLVVLENVVTPEEAWRLRELGAAQGYNRSEDVGKRRADGTYDSYANSGRTSTNAWCVNECYTDPVAQTVMNRIVHLTGGIPETNSENLQLLRYEEGQFYQTHSDFIPHQRERQPGVRILTFYIYLNDVEQGGGTNFPHVNNMTVTPKLGRAALWPSVLNRDPNKIDSRTQHQALPVEKGVKFGANAWIHQRDYKGPTAVGC